MLSRMEEGLLLLNIKLFEKLYRYRKQYNYEVSYVMPIEPKRVKRVESLKVYLNYKLHIMLARPITLIHELG